jgi:hypothetical protein
MSRYKAITLLALAAVLCAAVAGTVLGRWLKPNRPVDAQPILVIDANYLNFGEVWATNQFEWRLPLRNNTQSELTLESLTGDCSCLLVNPLPLRIASGQEAQVTLRLDLTRRCMGVGADPFASIPHPIQLRAAVRYGETTQDLNWLLEGRVKPAVILSKRRLDFGRLWDPPSKIERSVALRTAPGVEIQSFSLEGGAGRLSAELRQTSSFQPELVVCLAPLVAPGQYQGEVQVIPVTDTGELLGAVRLPVEWENLQEIQAETTTLDFGVHPVGSKTEQTLALISLSGNPFSVTDCRSHGNTGADIVRDRLEATDSVRVTVRQQVEHLGDVHGEIRLLGVTASGDPFTITCRTRYYGTGPAGH